MKFPGYTIGLQSPNTLAVKAIQARLSILGFGDELIGTGVYGPKTKRAVEDFQHSRILLEDGSVGKVTWIELFEVKEVKPSPSVKSSILTKRAIEIALQYIHVREKTGKNDGVEVEAFLKEAGLWVGLPWCAAFVHYVFKKAADQLGVKNPVYKTGGVLKMWNEMSEYRIAKNEEPKIGDIFIMDYGKGQGHTGIVIGFDGKDIFTIEGNTNSASSREGDGVYKRIRSRNSSLLKGYLRVS